MIFIGFSVIVELVILFGFLSYYFSKTNMHSSGDSRNLRSHPFRVSCPRTRIPMPDELNFVNSSWNMSLKEAYSIWYLPPADKAKTMKKIIYELADEYNGSYHDPHATLYGAIYSTDVTYLLEKTKMLASTIPPMHMRFRKIDIMNFRKLSRFRGGVTLRYVESPAFKRAAIFAANAFNRTDYQHPHTTLLYDREGNAAGRTCLNETIAEIFRVYHGQFTSQKNVKKISVVDLMSWKADSIALVYTPIRDHFLSTQDMKDLISQWKLIEAFPLKGSAY